MIGEGERARARKCPGSGGSRSPANRRRQVMRVWRTLHCARRGEKGHTRARPAPAPDPIALAWSGKELTEKQSTILESVWRKCCARDRRTHDAFA
jgi:hypothetical protein